MDLNTLEQKLKETIIPQLEESGRPEWDAPHTIRAAYYMRQILQSLHASKLNPTQPADEAMLVIAIWAHDWGNVGLYENRQLITGKEQMREQKELHAAISAERLAKLLEDPFF